VTEVHYAVYLNEATPVQLMPGQSQQRAAATGALNAGLSEVSSAQ
jgi:hypothetical protein